MFYVVIYELKGEYLCLKTRVLQHFLLHFLY